MGKWKSLSQRVGEPWATIVHVVCGLGWPVLYLLYDIPAISLVALFCLIQIVQVWKKGDSGWPELIQFGAASAGAWLAIGILTLMEVI